MKEFSFTASGIWKPQQSYTITENAVARATTRARRGRAVVR